MKFSIFEDLFSVPLRNGVSYASSKRGAGVPMVNMGEAFRYDRITNQKCERVPLTATEYEKYLLRDGDLLFVRQSLKYEGAGKCIYVGPGEEPRTWESHLIRVRLISAIADPRYYFYYFRSPSGRRLIESIVEQVAAAGIRGSDLRRLQVPRPAIEIQSSIADILCALDNKVDINDRIVGAAFEIAEAKYVQLSAKSSVTATLGHMMDLAYGKSLTANIRMDGEVPVYGSSGKVGTHSRALVSGPGVIVGRKGTVGAAYWSEEDFFPIDTTFFVKVKNSSIPMEFAFFVLRSLGLDTMNSDSAVPGLNRNNALALQVRVPGEADINKFRNEVRPIFALRHALDAESASLAKMRDTLLPKLMSGEIRVGDAERIVEEAT